MIPARGYVLTMQFLEIPAVMGHNAKSSLRSIGKLFGVRFTRLTLVSRCYRSESA